MPCLDGLRGLAAAVVVIGHGNEYGFAGPVAPLARDYGVLLFFVLSGFLMGALYLRKEPSSKTITQYIVARAGRIFPIYFAVVLASFAYYHLVDHSFVYAISATQLLRLLTFNGSVYVFWSIGPEVQFYAVFVLFWMLYFLSKPAFFVVIPLAAIVSLLTISTWPGIFVLSKLHVFTLGLLIAALRPPSLPPRVLTALHVLCIGLLVGIVSSSRFSDLFGPIESLDPKLTSFYGSLPRLIVVGLIVFGLSYETNLGRAIFANRFMTFLGTISFSLYLLHEPVMYFIDRIGIIGALGQYPGTALTLVSVTAVSWTSYLAIEQPARVFLKRTSKTPMESAQSFEPQRSST